MKKLLSACLTALFFVVVSATNVQAQTATKSSTETVATDSKKCDKDCKKACCAKKDKKACAKDCKKACCTDKKASACKPGCTKACCAKKEGSERAIHEEGVKATDHTDDE